jgi:hypothetical protein
MPHHTTLYHISPQELHHAASYHTTPLHITSHCSTAPHHFISHTSCHTDLLHTTPYCTTLHSTAYKYYTQDSLSSENEEKQVKVDLHSTLCSKVMKAPCYLFLYLYVLLSTLESSDKFSNDIHILILYAQ